MKNTVEMKKTEGFTFSNFMTYFLPCLDLSAEDELIEKAMVLEFLEDHNFAYKFVPKVSEDKSEISVELLIEATAHDALVEYLDLFFDAYQECDCDCEEDSDELVELIDFLVEYGHAEDEEEAATLILEKDFIGHMLDNEIPMLIVGSRVFLLEDTIRDVHEFLCEEEIVKQIAFEDEMAKFFVDMIASSDVNPITMQNILKKTINAL